MGLAEEAVPFVERTKRQKIRRRARKYIHTQANARANVVRMADAESEVWQRRKK